MRVQNRRDTCIIRVQNRENTGNQIRGSVAGLGFSRWTTHRRLFFILEKDLRNNPNRNHHLATFESDCHLTFRRISPSGSSRSATRQEEVFRETRPFPPRGLVLEERQLSRGRFLGTSGIGATHW